MKQKIFQEKYPVFVLELNKNETTCTKLDEILVELKAKIDTNETAHFIAIFDHYTHTRNLPNGSMMDGLLDAKNIVFCFGIAIPNPEVLAVRPRSIGIAEFADRFVISFMEAPMPVANTAMEAWVKGLKRAA